MQSVRRLPRGRLEHGQSSRDAPEVTYELPPAPDAPPGQAGFNRAQTVRRLTIGISVLLVFVTTTVATYRLRGRTGARLDRWELDAVLWTMLFAIPLAFAQCIPLYLFSKWIRSPISTWATSLLLLIGFALLYQDPVKDIWRPGDFLFLGFFYVGSLWFGIVLIGVALQGWETGEIQESRRRRKGI
jgi:hypothetical protein